MFHLNFRTSLLATSLAALLTTGCGGEEETKEVNHAPTADAGVNQTFSSNAPVSLSASGSFDPDGDPMTYHWSFDSVPSSSGVMSMERPFTINGEIDATTSFTPDAEGTYVISLIVTDARGLSSSPDRMIVTIQSGNPPIAEAGEEHTVAAGETVTLDGSSSYDDLGRDLTYSWTFARVPASSGLTALDSASSASATFAPDVSGIYLVALIVNNGLNDSAPDTTVVRVSADASDLPIAVAGNDVSGTDCSDIPLDGSESYDPNGEPITYLWDLESRPDGSTATTDSFDDRTSATPRFRADIEGHYVVSLSVHDGTGWSAPDVLTIIAEDRGYNSAPAVSPGAPRTIEGGEAICEEAAYSSYVCGYCEAASIILGSDAFVNDPDGDQVHTLWTVTDGSADIEDPTSVSTPVVLSGANPEMPDECAENTYTFTLSATDCTGAITTETVTHTVTCCGYTSTPDPDADSDADADADGGYYDGGYYDGGYYYGGYGPWW